MGQEIERKFLVRRLPELEPLDGAPIVQGYLRADASGSVRVRITGEGACLTVKGPSRGIRRLEFEYPVPAEDARHMLEALALGALVEKVRYRVSCEGFVWEVDVFSGRNEGLVIAEVELETEDDQPPVPEWVGAEVSGDARFLNANLARKPFLDWAVDEIATLLPEGVTAPAHAGGARA
jgi:adenylate cyclase